MKKLFLASLALTAFAAIQSGKLTFSNSGTMTGGAWKEISDGGVFYTGTYPTMSRVN